MAEFLGASDEVIGVVSATPFTLTYAAPAGSVSRLVLARIITDGGTDFTITYGGLPMSSREINSIDGGYTLILAALSLTGVTLANSVLSVTGNATERDIAAQVIVFDDINAQDADFSFGLSEGSGFDFGIESDPLETAEGDLIVSLCGSQSGATLTTTSFDESLGDMAVVGKHAGFAFNVDTTAGAQVAAWDAIGASATNFALITVAFSSCVEEFNCDCEAVSPYKTLAELRTEMMIGMGYAAQAANPPPGMAELIRFFLQQAQELLWLRYDTVRVERFYKWTMVPNLRYYGIDSNENCCPAVLDPLKVSWVGFEDLNRTWVQLIEGIPPEFYTRAQTTPGWPSHYEIRSCIEVFPAPQAAYTLWVKGQFGLGPLTADTDRTTIDDRAVLWMALSLSGRGPLAAKGEAMAIQRIKDITAGQHNTARFVPRPSGKLAPMTPPRFLPLGNEPA